MGPQTVPQMNSARLIFIDLLLKKGPIWFLHVKIDIIFCIQQTFWFYSLISSNIWFQRNNNVHFRGGGIFGPPSLIKVKMTLPMKAESWSLCLPSNSYLLCILVNFQLSSVQRDPIIVKLIHLSAPIADILIEFQSIEFLLEILIRALVATLHCHSLPSLWSEEQLLLIVPASQSSEVILISDEIWIVQSSKVHKKLKGLTIIIWLKKL